MEGELSLSFKFRTGASEAGLLYMRERTADHNISLSLSDGALHLRGSVYHGTSISPRTKETGEMLKLDDEEWHSVYLTLKDGGQFKFIVFKVDDIEMFTSVSHLPLLSSTQYQTWLGDLPPSLESEAGSAGCFRDIRVLLTDFQDLQLTGATTVECPTLTFQGPMLAIITQDHKVGSYLMNIQAVIGDGSSWYEIKYELADPEDYFSLDQTTGILTIASQLDRTSPKNIFSLTVRASTMIGK